MKHQNIDLFTIIFYPLRLLLTLICILQYVNTSNIISIYSNLIIEIFGIDVLLLSIYCPHPLYLAIFGLNTLFHIYNFIDLTTKLYISCIFYILFILFRIIPNISYIRYNDTKVRRKQSLRQIKLINNEDEVEFDWQLRSNLYKILNQFEIKFSIKDSNRSLQSINYRLSTRRADETVILAMNHDIKCALGVNHVRLVKDHEHILIEIIDPRLTRLAHNYSCKILKKSLFVTIGYDSDSNMVILNLPNALLILEYSYNLIILMLDILLQKDDMPNVIIISDSSKFDKYRDRFTLANGDSLHDMLKWALGYNAKAIGNQHIIIVIDFIASKISSINHLLHKLIHSKLIHILVLTDILDTDEIRDLIHNGFTNYILHRPRNIRDRIVIANKCIGLDDLSDNSIIYISPLTTPVRSFYS